MKLFTGILLCVSWACAVFGQSATDSSIIERKPLAISSGIDEGQLVSGRDEFYTTDAEGHRVGDRQWMSRLNVWLIQEVLVAKRLTLKMGVGGSFWYVFPELKGSPLNLVTKFGPGVAEASGTYKIGEIANPLFEFQFGYFPFKYNPDAYDMGEYLLRSGCYPGYLMNGRWNIIGDALYRALGIRFSNYLLDKTIQQHFLATMERDYPPMYDVALSYVGTAQIAKMFNVGVGASYAHLISMNESKTTPKDFNNRYLSDRALSGTEGVDLNTGVDSLKDAVKHFTNRGLKLMAMASFDIKPVIPTTIFGKEDLKIFAEMAVLGVENYPFYYDDITKRMPVMFGFNFPTFKLLDVLSFEWEWYGSQFDNNVYNYFESQLPIWTVSQGNPKLYDDTAAFSAESRYKHEGATTYRQYYDLDNWKWAIFAKKKLGKVVTLYLQMANDHMRMMDYWARPQHIDATRGVDSPGMLFQKDWYFDFKIQFGI